MGIVYKMEGQDAAIALGHKLVDPQRAKRVEDWISFLSAQELPLLTCFRGGLRSQITQTWVQESGQKVDRIEGGYKAIRTELSKVLEQPLSGIIVTGYTGSGKTRFLRSLAHRAVIDLEELAHHRGSAFGALGEAQPTQINFENALAIKIQKARYRVITEDESRLIGFCKIPHFEHYQSLPRIFLEAPVEERAQNIWNEYVKDSLHEAGKAALAASLFSVRKRLGGLAYQNIQGKMMHGFLHPTYEENRPWIMELLEVYYDKLYEHSMSQEPIFRGNASECREWLRTQTDLLSAHSTDHSG